MATIKERLTQALQNAGWTEDTEHRSMKRTAFKPGARAVERSAIAESRYFLGKAGSFRYSADGRATGSYPSETLKRRLLAKVPQ